MPYWVKMLKYNGKGYDIMPGVPALYMLVRDSIDYIIFLCIRKLSMYRLSCY